jgi:hypothetical protein
MTSLLSNPEQWYDAYEAASPRQRHQILLEVVEQPLSPEFLEETDFGGLLLEMQDELVNNNLLTETLALIAKFQQYQPELYAQEYAYFDKFLIEYYLYNNDLEKVQASLARFQENPVKDIDEMLRVLDFLKFYNATDVAAKLCQATYHLVENSSEVIGGTEAELGSVIFTDLMDKAYRKIKQREEIDWDEFSAKAKKYGYQSDRESIDDIHQNLQEDIEINEQFLKAFKKQQSRNQILSSLSVDFHKYMASEKQVSFICSQGILETIMKFLINYRDLKAKELAHPDSLFGFSQSQLDRFVAQQIGGFFSLGQAASFATLWGIPYLYDFLAAKQIIRSEIHQRAIAAATELKKQLTKVFSQLWKFDFVHRWLPPDSVSEADWEAEVKQFAASLEEVKPLSDEPGEGMMASLQRKLKQFIGEEEEEEPEKELAGELLEFAEEEPAVPPPPVKSYKPPKPKKSPLQEAAGLSDKKKKKPNKKRNKKGFDLL